MPFLTVFQFILNEALCVVACCLLLRKILNSMLLTMHLHMAAEKGRFGRELLERDTIALSHC